MYCVVDTPMYMNNDKYYIHLTLFNEELEKIKKIHGDSGLREESDFFMNPLNGRVLKVKVPFRYNRVSCNVMGQKTIQQLKKGDYVDTTVKFCGPWSTGKYSGFAWKIVSLRYLPPQ